MPSSPTDNGFDRRRPAVIAVWLGLVGLGLYLLFTQARIATDISAFLPKATTPRQHILIGQLQQGPVARIIMVALENAPPEALAATSNALANSLARSNAFGLIANGAFELREQNREWLFARRYLLSPTVTAERFQPEGLRQALEATRERLRTPLGDLLRPLVSRDPTGELPSMLGAMDHPLGPAVRHGVWFDKSGTKALLLLEIRIPALTIETQDAIKQEIERAFASAAPPDMRMTLAGPAIYAVESRNVIERESLIFSLLAVALIVALLAWVYRSPWQMILVFIPALSGILAAVVIVSWHYGTIHGITLAFAITLLAESVDYPSYVLLQARRGLPLSLAARDIWPTLRLAVLTTLAGSLAMLFSSIQGLSQLGLLAVIGVAIAGLVNRWVIPALAPYKRPISSESWSPPAWLREGLRPRVRLTVAFAMLSLLALAVSGFDWQDDLGAFNPLPSAIKKRDQQLRSDLSAPDVRFLIAYPAPDVEQALRGSEEMRPKLDSLVREKLLAGYEMATDYLPSITTQRARLAALPDNAELARNLSRAAHDAGFRPDVLTPFLAEIDQARRLAPITLETIGDQAWKLRAENLLFRHAGGVAALVTLKGVADSNALSARAHTLAPALLIDLRQETSDLVAGYRWQILIYTGIGMALIAALLFAHLRHIGMTIRVLLPPLLGIFCTVTILTLTGERISLFHLVALLLVLGIGINYALFFRQSSINEAGANRVLFSLLVCLISTLIGFGALALSSTPVLHGIGMTSFCGTALSFLFSAWLAPAARTLAPESIC